ncbi:MAG: restriction endonuclease [Phycisphaerales bacterium]
MHGLHPRRFEELVAELLDREGFEVQLTPESRDGGKDIYAVQSNALGRFLFVVECKRYALGKPVGIEFVQRLAGVVDGMRANAGIIATTSRFTRPAIECQERDYRTIISLRDYTHLQQWLNRAARRPT